MAPPTSKPKSSQPTSKRIRETDSDDPSENELSQPTSSTATPRFLVISATEERQMSSLSPFVIEKTLHGIAGVPKSVEKLRSGDLLVEYVNKKHIEHLLRTKKFFDLAVKVSLHSFLNTCKGAVRYPDLRGCREQEILENMREQGVTDVRRIKIRRDRTLKDTNTFVFTFNTPVLPKQLKVAFLRVSVDAYIPNPLRCYQCQVFGHHENKCKREQICANCGQPKQSADEIDCKCPAKCINCKEDHPANSKLCQAWHTEKEILKSSIPGTYLSPKRGKSLTVTRHHPVKVMPALRRLLVSQYHVLMLRRKQTLYSSQELHGLCLTIQHPPKHLPT